MKGVVDGRAQAGAKIEAARLCAHTGDALIPPACLQFHCDAKHFIFFLNGLNRTAFNTTGIFWLFLTGNRPEGL